jgi:alkylation response protein AidB-like acyl-CoA dehydrogenase
MTAAETEAFVASVRALLTDRWPAPADQGGAATGSDHALRALWAAAAENGWFELALAGHLSGTLAAVQETGRAACPLPVLDALVTARLFPSEIALLDAVVRGEVRLTAAPAPEPGTDPVPFVEVAEAATHVLIVDGRAGGAAVQPIATRSRTPGLAWPDWAEVTLADPVCRTDDTAAVEEAIVLLRLGLAVRALAAAERTHEAAIAHARTRSQFGRVIGSFGAIQQRTATCEIDVRAGWLLVEQAVRALAADARDALLTAEIATGHVATQIRHVQLAAHHTLAAVGYFTEHEAPWLFRRLHADITRLAALRPAGGDVTERLVACGAGLPVLDVGPGGQALRAQVREFVAEHRRADGTFDEDQVTAAMAAKGWFGLGWPAEYGGRSASLAEQVVLAEEITYGRVPVTLQMAAVTLMGPAILRHGSAEQKERVLGLIRSGELRFCLGYSEPEAGSDLASLRTRAVRDGDEWVINGQKLWSTGAHVATHVWLATRTGPDTSPRHAGITVFLVPMDTPGITVHEHTALSGEISCTVYYDDVRVPDSCRVGAVDGGWAVITDALAGERIVMGGIAASLARQLDDLLAIARQNPETVLGPPGSAKRARLAELAVRVQATRALVAAAISAAGNDADDTARLAAPMAGVMGGEVAEEFGEAALDILGPAAALGAGASGALAEGAFEYGLRLAPMYVIGGGTNDIQRGLVARGLGLPR